MAWADYDNDGDLDLYVNRLYRNEGEGIFTDVAQAAGVDDAGVGGSAWADYDNDGDLDLFVANNLGPNRLYRNEGEGTFAEVSEQAGVRDPAVSGFGVAWGDYDNDGDLDLYLANWGRNRLYANEGEGTFADVAQAAGVGNSNFGTSVAWADYDNDGDLDLYHETIDTANRLYRNEGTAHHGLVVECVGTSSNRSGIGAVVTAVTGAQRQRRDGDGGSGFYSQPSLPVEFGLGNATKADSLIVAWPSGQVDVFTDLAADQSIRVFEGQPAYHRIQPTVWERPPRDPLVAGSTARIQATLRPARFEAEAEITQITADLSNLGGPTHVPFNDQGDGTWQLETPFEVGSVSGWIDLLVQIDQATSLGPYRTTLSTPIAVLPVKDQVIFADALAEDWQVKFARRVELDDQENKVVFEGASALAFRNITSNVNFRATFTPTEPVDLLGYAVRFAFHPGDATLPAQRAQLSAIIGRRSVDLLSDTGEGVRVNMDVKEWQVVEVSSEVLNLTTPINSISFTGRLDGTFYVDDIRLVAAPLPSSATAVREAHTATLPQSFTLDPNYPNPFNSQTVIRFALPVQADVELSVYNLAGQKVGTLVEGMRPAGTYSIHWDGRDAQGRELASGVYLYRLTAGGQVESRKLLLLR